MNEAIQVLRKRQAVELEALSAVTVAVSVVERARQRRAAEVERLDAVVTEAERGADVALAVLASLMSVDVAAGLVQVPVARVRQAQQHAPVEDVGLRVQDLTGDTVRPATRGRPRGAGRSSGLANDVTVQIGVVADGAPIAAVAAGGGLEFGGGVST